MWRHRLRVLNRVELSTNSMYNIRPRRPNARYDPACVTHLQWLFDTERADEMNTLLYAPQGCLD